MSGCICGYAQENLRLCARANVPTHRRKNGLPHEVIFTPSRGKSNLPFRGSIYAHNDEHGIS